MDTKPAISKATTVVAAKDQLSADLKGEAVILNCANGVYYGLNEVGNTVWSFVQEPRKVAEITAKIASEYEVPMDVCERDVLELLGQLAQAGLIEIRG
jgi:coenzyme PQQ synthesis protein D (PqqD)